MKAVVAAFNQKKALVGAVSIIVKLWEGSMRALAKAHLLHDVEGEGADLLEGVDGDLVLQSAVPPLLQQVIVHLARADQDLTQPQHIRTLGEQEEQ